METMLARFRAARGFVSLVVFVSCSGLFASQDSVSTSHQEFFDRLVKAAVERTNHSVRYEPSYVHIPYPGGDVPADKGVCRDEIIRAYRAVESTYRKKFTRICPRISRSIQEVEAGLRLMDTNIDHRRVPNLMVFFQRKGSSLPITGRAHDYTPGDLVTWDLTAVCSHRHCCRSQRVRWARHDCPHIGQGPKMEDVPFNWKITGHYRYHGLQAAISSALGAGFRSRG
jgi:uncharacterized protein YijF (DUF1287 family)